MGRPINHNEHELIITITRGGVASTSTSQGNDHNDLHESYCEETTSANLQVAISESSSLSSSSSSSSASASSPIASNSRHTSFSRRGDSNSRRRRSPLNSGLWISIELVVIMSQIIAAIVVLSLSGHEHPRAPLFLWVIGYTAGCVASLPYLYWRYIHGNRQGSQQDSTHSQQSSSQNNPPESTSYTVISFPRILEGQERNNSAAVSRFRQNLVSASPRLNVLVDHFKMALDCFFAVWFVVGNVWIFGGHSSTSDAPNLYRLCIVFLTFSCIGYAMPFILCVTLCCCLPCIISILGFREDMRQTRGASTESINALPTYKFKSKRGLNRQESDISSESLCEGGILAAGTDKERIISAEDAVCCICLTEYVDNDELRGLPCTHFFHQECVEKWLKINALCPLCKSEIVDAAR